MGDELMQKLAYILSHSYSGSTLLTLLLGAHPEIATIGELKARAMGDVDKYSCSCGQPIRKCLFWKKVQAEMRQRGLDFNVDQFGTDFSLPNRRFGNAVLHSRVRGQIFERLRRDAISAVPAWRKRFNQIADQNKAVIEIIMRLQGGRMFLDGSKDPIRLMHLTASGLWDMRVIHLVRDGRGAVCSYMRHYNAPMERAAREWRITDTECRRALAATRAQATVTMHYEDLCRQPNDTIAAICRFLDIDVDTRGARIHSTEQHVIGNGMRLRFGSAIRLDEKWRHDLSSRDLSYFDDHCGMRNSNYGYV